eukprot:g4595.t1
MLNSRKVILIWLLISLCVATTHSTVTTKPPVKPKPAATPKQAVTTTSVPTVEPEPINIQYKAMLYRLDFQTIPTISPAMRAVLLLTTLYYIIVFAKAMVEIQIYRTEGKKSKSINEVGENDGLLEGNDMGSKLAGYERNLRGVMEGIPMLAILITFARLRARVDLEGTAPQDWAQVIFLVAVCILYLQAVVAVCCSPGKEQKNMKKARGLQKAVGLIKIFLTVCLMICVVGIFVSIYTLKKKPIYDKK